MRLSRTQIHVNLTSLSLVIKAHICVSQRSDQQEQARKNTSQIDNTYSSSFAKTVNFTKKESLHIGSLQSFR
jgi:hypothetical protein